VCTLRPIPPSSTPIPLTSHAQNLQHLNTVAEHDDAIHSLALVSALRPLAATAAAPTPDGPPLTAAVALSSPLMPPAPLGPGSAPPSPQQRPVAAPPPTSPHASCAPAPAPRTVAVALPADGGPARFLLPDEAEAAARAERYAALHSTAVAADNGDADEGDEGSGSGAEEETGSDELESTTVATATSVVAVDTAGKSPLSDGGSQTQDAQVPTASVSAAATPASTPLAPPSGVPLPGTVAPTPAATPTPATTCATGAPLSSLADATAAAALAAAAAAATAGAAAPAPTVATPSPLSSPTSSPPHSHSPSPAGSPFPSPPAEPPPQPPFVLPADASPTPMPQHAHAKESSRLRAQKQPLPPLATVARGLAVVVDGLVTAATGGAAPLCVWDLAVCCAQAGSGGGGVARREQVVLNLPFVALAASFFSQRAQLAMALPLSTTHVAASSGAVLATSYHTGDIALLDTYGPLVVPATSHAAGTSPGSISGGSPALGITASDPPAQAQQPLSPGTLVPHTPPRSAPSSGGSDANTSSPHPQLHARTPPILYPCRANLAMFASATGTAFTAGGTGSAGAASLPLGIPFSLPPPRHPLPAVPTGTPAFAGPSVTASGPSSRAGHPLKQPPPPPPLQSATTATKQAPIPPHSR